MEVVIGRVSHEESERERNKQLWRREKGRKGGKGIERGRGKRTTETFLMT